MGYIEQSLTANEKIIYRTGLHWIVLVTPCFFSGLFFIIGFTLLITGNDVLFLVPGFFIIIAGIAIILLSIIDRNAVEMAVTNKRVIVKLGWLRRRTVELFLSKVESVHIEQGIIARMLDYGTINLRGTGGTYEPFKSVCSPLEFRRQVQYLSEAHAVPVSDVSVPSNFAVAPVVHEPPHALQPSPVPTSHKKSNWIANAVIIGLASVLIVTGVAFYLFAHRSIAAPIATPALQAATTPTSESKPAPSTSISESKPATTPSEPTLPESNFMGMINNPDDSLTSTNSIQLVRAFSLESIPVNIPLGRALDQFYHDPKWTSVLAPPDTMRPRPYSEFYTIISDGSFIISFSGFTTERELQAFLISHRPECKTAPENPKCAYDPKGKPDLDTPLYITIRFYLDSSGQFGYFDDSLGIGWPRLKFLITGLQ